MGHKTALLVRGGGDLASGVIHRLYCCGYRVLVLECHKPSAIRQKGFLRRGCISMAHPAVEGVTGRSDRVISAECQKKSGKRKRFRFLVDETGETDKKT